MAAFERSDSYAELAVSGGGMIVGFAGKKQVGKSTAAGFLVAAGFRRISFADPMKRMASGLLRAVGFSDGDISYYENNKELAMPVIGVSMRHLLQSLGTDWGRNLIHPDLWVMAASSWVGVSMANAVDVVIEDVRFENEAAFIRKHGGLILHIERETGYQDGHASEAGIKFKPGDAVIYNTDKIEALRVAVLGLAGVSA